MTDHRPEADTAGGPSDWAGFTGAQQTSWADITATASDTAELDVDQLELWVHTTLLPIYERGSRDGIWCPRWWEHPEAIFRLELVRRNWTHAVVAGPDALNKWSLQCADPHLAVLFSSDGPFGDCGRSREAALSHQPNKVLPQEWSPAVRRFAVTASPLAVPLRAFGALPNGAAGDDRNGIPLLDGR